MPKPTIYCYPKSAYHQDRKGSLESQTTGQIGFKLTVQNWVKSPESLDTYKIGFTYIDLQMTKNDMREQPRKFFRGKMLLPRSQRPGPDGILIFAMVSGRYLNQAVSGEYVATRAEFTPG
jgi:hypothetical protein